MLYSEIIAVCSQIHTKHINTLCGQNVELLNVKPCDMYGILTAGTWRINESKRAHDAQNFVFVMVSAFFPHVTPRTVNTQLPAQYEQRLASPRSG